VAASNIKELNQRVAAEARSRGILVNTAEVASGGECFPSGFLGLQEPEGCRFELREVSRLCQALAEVLGAWLGRGFPLALEVLTALREAHLRSGVGQERFVVEPSLAVTLSELLAQGSTHEARGILEKAYPNLLHVIPAALGRAA